MFAPQSQTGRKELQHKRNNFHSNTLQNASTGVLLKPVFAFAEWNKKPDKLLTQLRDFSGFCVLQAQ